MRGLLKQDVTLAALYRVGAVRRFDGPTLERLMIDRADMLELKAKQLAAHWLTTEPYRAVCALPYFKPRHLERVA